MLYIISHHDLLLSSPIDENTQTEFNNDRTSLLLMKSTISCCFTCSHYSQQYVRESILFRQHFSLSINGIWRPVVNECIEFSPKWLVITQSVLKCWLYDLPLIPNNDGLLMITLASQSQMKNCKTSHFRTNECIMQCDILWLNLHYFWLGTQSVHLLLDHQRHWLWSMSVIVALPFLSKFSEFNLCAHVPCGYGNRM